MFFTNRFDFTFLSDNLYNYEHKLILKKFLEIMIFIILSHELKFVVPKGRVKNLS